MPQLKDTQGNWVNNPGQWQHAQDTDGVHKGQQAFPLTSEWPLEPTSFQPAVIANP